MNFRHKIQFSGALKSVAIVPEVQPRFFSEAEMEAALQEAYQKGVEETSILLEQQTLGERNELAELANKTFHLLQTQHDSLVQQLRGVIPDLVMETVNRIFAGFEMNRETVETLVNEILREVPPGKQALEVVLSPHDLELIQEIQADFRERYPSIEFRSDAALNSGDCVARTRFGVIDGRLATKLKTVESFLR